MSSVCKPHSRAVQSQMAAEAMLTTGGSNLSQMLEGTPAATLADLHKHDAVDHRGDEASYSATAITVLTGVDQSQRVSLRQSSGFSASWNLNGGGSSAGSGGTP